MIDDDWTLDEGDPMPAVWWRLDGRIPLTVRSGPRSNIPGLPLLAYGPEFSGGVLSVSGPIYLDLAHFTCWDAYRPWQTTPQRAAFDALQAAHPDTFSTVIGRDGPTAVWLTLRLTRLTDPITDTLLAVHDRTCPTRTHPWVDLTH
ncbi:hypothetical protein [Dactylosporangium sp. NPDC048998]|uniref:hypothetical protein n=1 Tax=Dactylosporangium sp. NPDC048998 TaxID=3363976 RepID=UPI0037200CB8